MGRFAQVSTGIQNVPAPAPINPAARHFGAFDARCHAGRTRRTRDPATDLPDRMRNPYPIGQVHVIIGARRLQGRGLAL